MGCSSSGCLRRRRPPIPIVVIDAIRNLDAARLAADVCGVPTVLVARTDAESAKLITSDVDERDRQFLTGERTPEGFFRLKDGTGLDHCIARGLAFAPHADLLWWETSHPDLEDARAFAEASASARTPGGRPSATT